MCRSFEQQIQSTAFLAAFDRLRRNHPTLREFKTPAELVKHQQSTVPAPAERDRVLHALIETSRVRGDTASAAGSLLFLSMVPGLTLELQGVRSCFDSEEECVGEITLAFFEKVARWNIANRTHVAANLRFSTRRMVLERRMKSWADAQRISVGLDLARAFTDTEGPEEVSVADLWARLACGTTDYSPDDIELLPLRKLLSNHLGLSCDDVELLVLKGPCRQSWEAIGARLRVNPETARKRFQRLRDRVRGHSALDA